MKSVLHDPLPIDPDPVGKWLADELEAREWSQADFAAILGRPTQFVSEIINGKKEITRESAAQIGAALGQTAEMWLSLQDQYLLAQQAKDVRAQAKLSDVRKRALISQHAPVELLRKRGILQATNLDDLAREVMDLFELNSLEDEPAFLAAARRANRDENLSALQRAWFRASASRPAWNRPRSRTAPRRSGGWHAACRRRYAPPRTSRACPTASGKPAYGSCSSTRSLAPRSTAARCTSTATQ